METIQTITDNKKKTIKLKITQVFQVVRYCIIAAALQLTARMAMNEIY